jgi:hypothetical protein
MGEGKTGNPKMMLEIDKWHEWLKVKQGNAMNFLFVGGKLARVSR